MIGIFFIFIDFILFRLDFCIVIFVFFVGTGKKFSCKLYVYVFELYCRDVLIFIYVKLISYKLMWFICYISCIGFDRGNYNYVFIRIF